FLPSWVPYQSSGFRAFALSCFPAREGPLVRRAARLEARSDSTARVGKRRLCGQQRAMNTLAFSRWRGVGCGPARVLLMVLAVAFLSPAARPDERSTARRFAAARRDEPSLIAFLRSMPKGADLHNHVGGALYSEEGLRQA